MILALKLPHLLTYMPIERSPHDGITTAGMMVVDTCNLHGNVMGACVFADNIVLYKANYMNCFSSIMKLLFAN